MRYVRVGVLAAVIGILAAVGTPALATVTYLDFDNIAPYPGMNDVLIDEYYKGGTSSVGSSGPNLGAEFFGDALVLCLNTAGTQCSNASRGGLGIPSSALGALYVPSAIGIISVPAGFDTAFSFVYTNPFNSPTTVQVYSGLIGNATVLASLTLPGTPAAACNDAPGFRGHGCAMRRRKGQIARLA